MTSQRNGPDPKKSGERNSTDAFVSACQGFQKALELRREELRKGKGPSDLAMLEQVILASAIIKLLELEALGGVDTSEFRAYLNRWLAGVKL